MAFLGAALGRASGVSVAPSRTNNDPVQIVGLADFLRKATQQDANFNKEIRIASQEIAQKLVVKARIEAGSITRSRQAVEVMKGMRARRDRIPTIKLDEKSAFQSQSRKFTSARSDNGRRVKRKVTRGDVFFGAEFGGGRSPTTKQFLRHRGKAGYFFWPTVRKEKTEIAREYLAAIDRFLVKLSDERAAIAKARSDAGGVFNMTDQGLVFVKD